MYKINKYTIGMGILLFAWPVFASSLADCKKLSDCEAKACEVKYKLNIVKRQYKDDKIKQLTLELEEIEEYCESDKQREIYIDEMNEIYKRIYENQKRLEAATEDGKTDLVKKYKTEIAKEKITIDKMSGQLGKMKTSSH